MVMLRGGQYNGREWSCYGGLKVRQMVMLQKWSV